MPYKCEVMDTETWDYSWEMDNPEDFNDFGTQDYSFVPSFRILSWVTAGISAAASTFIFINMYIVWYKEWCF